MSVTVQTTDGIVITTTPAEMAALTGGPFPASERVPGIGGEGFDLADWFGALAKARVESRDATIPAPTHLTVKAADEFHAVIPWSQLAGAFFLYAMNGEPLARGGPLRLYVPDGTSTCLNVKSVTSIRFASDPGLGDEASYGFRNEISPVRLSQGFKTRSGE